MPFCGAEFSITSAKPVDSAIAASKTNSLEKKQYDVYGVSVGSSKVKVIKVVRECLGTSLAETKDLVDSMPTVLFHGVSYEQAEEYKNKLLNASADMIIEIK